MHQTVLDSFDFEEDIRSYINKKIDFAQILAKNKTNGFHRRHAYKKITKYIDKFLQGGKADTDRIIVMPGLRGVGKTTLLLQLYLYLIEEKKIPIKRVLYFSADESRAIASVSEIIDAYIQDVLHTSLEELDEQIFILMDEAHSYTNWAEVAKTKIYDQTNNIFLLVTGSSAISLETNDVLGRRKIKEALFPLNFSEYLLLTHHILTPNGLTSSTREAIFNPEQVSLDDIDDRWRDLRAEIRRKKLSLEDEFIRFMSLGGCPISGRDAEIVDDEIAYQRINSTIRKVIYRDLPYFKSSFDNTTLIGAEKVIAFLALKPSGAVAFETIGRNIGMNKTTVRNILYALEKAHFTFSVKPYGGASVVRDPWNHYFIHPCINATIRHIFSSVQLSDRHVLGVLAENLVAAYLFRMKETLTNVEGKSTGVFYPSEQGKRQKEKNVDFLIQDARDKILPIEVSIGKTKTAQVVDSIRRYNSDYGILISNFSTITKEDNILRIPLPLFALV